MFTDDLTVEFNTILSNPHALVVYSAINIGILDTLNSPPLYPPASGGKGLLGLFCLFYI